MFYTVAGVLVGTTTGPTKSDETWTVVRVRVKRDGSPVTGGFDRLCRKVINHNISQRVLI
jgi:hypothetical protein